MSQTLRVCLVGAGRVAQVHGHSLAHYIPAAHAVAVVDPNEETLNALGDQFGIGARYTALADALEGTAFDAVVITTPTFTHQDLAVWAPIRRLLSSDKDLP